MADGQNPFLPHVWLALKHSGYAAEDLQRLDVEEWMRVCRSCLSTGVPWLQAPPPPAKAPPLPETSTAHPGQTPGSSSSQSCPAKPKGAAYARRERKKKTAVGRARLKVETALRKDKRLAAAIQMTMSEVPGSPGTPTSPVDDDAHDPRLDLCSHHHPLPLNARARMIVAEREQHMHG